MLWLSRWAVAVTPAVEPTTALDPAPRYVYGEDAEAFTFSFFTDVSQSPAVIKHMLQAQHEVSSRPVCGPALC